MQTTKTSRQDARSRNKNPLRCTRGKIAEKFNNFFQFCSCEGTLYITQMGKATIFSQNLIRLIRCDVSGIEYDYIFL